MAFVKKILLPLFALLLVSTGIFASSCCEHRRPTIAVEQVPPGMHDLSVGRVRLRLQVFNNDTMVMIQNEVRVRLNAPVDIEGDRLRIRCGDKECTCDVEPIQARDRIREMLMEHLNISVPEESIADLEIAVKGDHAYYIYRHRVRARLLWIIPVEAPVEVDVDVETGDATIVRPWWWVFITSIESSE